MKNALKNPPLPEITGKDALLRFKFGSDYEFCFDTFCDWLLAAYEKLEEKDFDAVVPVPSFECKSTRLSELAEKFSLLSGIPFRPEHLNKIRKTEKQHKLSASERRLNLIGAFSADSSVYGKKILLVDDIFTTGSTVAECANALYDKGAEKVCISISGQRCGDTDGCLFSPPHGIDYVVPPLTADRSLTAYHHTGHRTDNHPACPCGRSYIPAESSPSQNRGEQPESFRFCCGGK